MDYLLEDVLSMTQQSRRNYGLVIGAMVLAGITFSSPEANADILSLRTDLRSGIAGGKGMFGERKDNAFHPGGVRPAYGLLVGAEVFFLDGWIQHDQFLTSGDVSGTWTQFMLGVDVEIDLGELKGYELTDSGDKEGGYSSLFFELGMGVGFGVGTGKQVEPPLDNGELTDKGFLFEARGMLGYRLTEMFSLGLTVPLSFGYYTKVGAGTTANNVDNHYSGMSAAGMLTFRANLSLK